ncbi:4'-phosphopantetheinyl transferase superfamily protein [Rothia sp. ZJ932]|uniref:4'-phosphopantetheinyl transferase family protein n=1 Tax=Rothia sp. ZJ932 TaxID=2810516 RepID=UPI001966D014|nr:4'-phosphopantetheinyl transferase superfamily protein [Rothia sp. ZJ932]QRZ61906.1 4'-phosphopantetheinyl transferase superfamily protein [Rothia sp. ZJ932]
MSVNPTAALPPVRLFLLPPSILRSGYGVSWLAYVGMAEQRRAAEFTHPDDAMTYAAQQTLMRCMAASVLGVKPTAAAEIPVDRTCRLCTSYAEHGKPRINGVNLNMSRTTGMTVGGFTPATDILLGIDLERLRGSLHNSLDRVALADPEKDLLATAPENHQALLRTLLWSAKESVLKATGHGLSVDPRAVVITPHHTQQGQDALPYTRASARFTTPAGERYDFEVQWFVQGEYYISVATSAPVTVSLHPVTTPKMVREILGTS